MARSGDAAVMLRPAGSPVTATPALGEHRPRLHMVLRAVAAVASGVVLYVGFAPRSLWWLAPLSFPILAVALHHRRMRAGFGYGYLAGLGFFLPLLPWTGEYVGATPWLALSVLQALFVAVAGAGIAAVSRLPVWPVWAATVWVAAEVLRSRIPFGGFTWGKVAFGQGEGAYLPQCAPSRPGLQRATARGARQPRRTHRAARRGRRRRSGAAAGPGDLAGKLLGHRSASQPGRPSVDRSCGAVDRRAGPVRCGAAARGQVAHEHHGRVGPADRAGRGARPAAVAALRRVHAPTGTSSGSSARTWIVRAISSPARATVRST